MGYLEIIIFLIIIVIALSLKLKRDRDVVLKSRDNPNEEKRGLEFSNENIRNELVIQMEMLPAEEVIDENKLVEIKDRKVLAHVNNLIPGFAQVGNAAHNAVQATQAKGEVLYRAIIPAGAKLTDSKAMENAVRGIYHGADGIKGHANLVAVKGPTALANTAAAAMGVASMVVGQYYMTQINTELGKISQDISKVIDFQDNEYRSKVFSLLTHVKRIANFQVEILENNELRLSKITQLDSLEVKGTELLGQANLTLVEYTQKKEPDYNVYEENLGEIQKWYMYQKSLLDVLYKISELRYALHFGQVSREQCVALLPTYTQQVIDAREELTNWHKDMIKYLNIETEEKRIKRFGLDRALYTIPSLFKDEFKYKSMAENTVKLIEEQSVTIGEIYDYDTSTLYTEDVQLIAKDGKIYYLPETILGRN